MDSASLSRDLCRARASYNMANIPLGKTRSYGHEKVFGMRLQATARQYKYPSQLQRAENV